MKKFFAFAAAAAMMFSASAETLDLYFDATEYLPVAPFNTNYVDEVGNRTQVMYPAADLTAMVGQDIKAITFYTEEEGCTLEGGLFNISMGETELDALTGYVEGLTPVGTFSFTKNIGEVTAVTITFDTPYRYNGGNLVFDNIVVESTRAEYTYWTGIKSDNAKNCLVFSFGSATPRGFYPKTTFTYGDDTPEPQFLRGDVDDNGEVKIGDVTALISYLLSGDATGINLLAADCDQNGEIKIGDVTALISYLLSGSWE